MTDTAIRIELIRVGGRLYGRRVGDRFNLETFLGPLYQLHHDRSNSAVKMLRRRLEREYGRGTFVVVLVRGNRGLAKLPTPAEARALGPAVAAYVDAEYREFIPSGV